MDKIKILTENSVEITLLELTQNGLQKSIMDATATIRTYLKEKNLHDYDIQQQGPNNKIQIESFLIEDNKLTSSVASLYRPLTKQGDQGYEFKGLPDYVKPNEILCLFEFEKLYMF